MSSNKYIKFLELSLKTVQSSRLNLYSCKYSKRVYTQHQLLVLVLLKEYISTDYRDFVELVDLMSSIKEKLDLDKVPHYTTLQKFVFRIPSLLFNLILSKTLKLFYYMEKRLLLQQSMQLDLRVYMQVIIIELVSKLLLQLFPVNKECCYYH